MPRPRSSVPQSQPVILKPIDAVPKLREALAKADGLATMNATIDDCLLWMTETDLLLAAAFGRGSSEHVEFQHAGRPMSVTVAGPYSDAQILNDGRGEVKAKALALRAFTNHLALVADLTSTTGADTTANSSGTRKPSSTKVFVVHGHDTATRETVARFLDRLGLEAIILHEQPNRGRTIVEKFEEHAGEVGYAVVLLTGDDVGEVSERAACHGPSAELAAANDVLAVVGLTGNLRPKGGTRARRAITAVENLLGARQRTSFGAIKWRSISSSMVASTLWRKPTYAIFAGTFGGIAPPRSGGYG